MSHARILPQAGSRLLQSRRSSVGLAMALRPGAAAAAAAAAVTAPRASQFHVSSPARMPYKDDQDRESLKPKSQEYVKSDEGGDDAAAHKDSAAFDPSKTRPESEKAAANGGNNPLDVSPANKDVSAGKDKENKTSGQQKQKSSGGGGRK